MSKDRILAIEDDEGVCRLLRHSLAREDYLVRVVHTGEDGLAEAMKNPPDLFLLDLELPGMDGLAVCQELKQNPVTRSLPVIILTGKGEESDVVLGLEMGADDYIVKPFSPKILNARVQAVLRRRVAHEPTMLRQEVLRFGPLVVDTGRNGIKVSDVDVDLSPPEYRFALYLACFLSGADRSGCPGLPEGEDPAETIGREGMALYSENRLVRLLPVFEGLIEAGYGDAPLLNEFYGLALLEKDPDKALQCLTAAEKALHEGDDPPGELVALAQLIFFHVVFDGDQKIALRYLERAEALNQTCFDRLSVYSRVAVSQNLAIGRSMLLNDFAGANEYLAIAEALAENRGLINLVVLNRMVKIVESYTRGDQEAMVGGIEDSLRFANHPQVSRLHKTMIRVLQLKYFSLVGDFTYLQIQEKKLLEKFQDHLSRDNIVSVHLVVCQLESLLFRQQFEAALQLASDALAHPNVAANDLVRPFLNGFRALSAALCHRHDAMQEAIDACRREAGPVTFRLALAKLFCARALALTGAASAASALLADIAPVISEQGWLNLDFQLRAQQLLLQQQGGQDAAPTESLASLLAEMQERDVWYLATLVEEDYHTLYRLALASEPLEEFAREMLRRRLDVDYDEEGNPFPLLRLSTLGGLKIALADRPAARTDEFSRTQREFLALLAAMPDHRISQEEVQLTFWPDSRPEKARSTLDTMLSRLRRTLKEKFNPYPVKKFLRLQKGVISCENVIVDAVVFTTAVGRAREHLRRHELWQADVAFSQAFSLWQGPFMPGSCSADPSAVYAVRLQQTCIDAALEWSELLNESGQMSRSIEVLNRALAIDRSNEAVMKALYRSHMRDGNLVRAHQLLQQFEEILRTEGYTASEAARTIASFKSSDSGRS